MKKETVTKFYSLYRMQIFTAVVALASLFLIIFVIYPQTARLIGSQKKIDEIQNKSKLLENKVVALEGFDEEELSRKVSYVLGAVPQEKDFGNTLSMFKQLAEQSGFTINAITFSSGGKLGNLDTYGVRLDVRGPKIMLSSLLNSLENSPRVIRMSAIEVLSSQSSQSVDAVLALAALYSEFSPQSSGADASLPELSKEDEELIAKLSESSGIVLTGDIASVPRGKANPFD